MESNPSSFMKRVTLKHEIEDEEKVFRSGEIDYQKDS
jgi:hypothetical protein